eukprot:TRINITY_DN77874_c0_g1_i1.p1 TRINITY_DN77874_c0_g1~~TRINITY_DN77874_c0_g1_i1.p1  ORF type:complete len:725 (+),score=387.29 TRINITY_DN77874_c0_g1_i1:126-2177(+)
MRRFEKLQQAFGWGIDRAMFEQLFVKRLSSGSALVDVDAEWALWDEDRNGVADVLEIVAGVTMVANGKFEEKIKAIFKLFDFDSNKAITMNEMVILVRTCWSALIKMTLLEANTDAQGNALADAKTINRERPPLPSTTQLEEIATAAFAKADCNKDKKLSIDEFVQWAYGTAAVVHTVGRFGTIDATSAKSKFASIRRSESVEFQRLRQSPARAKRKIKSKNKRSVSSSSSASSSSSSRVRKSTSRSSVVSSTSLRNSVSLLKMKQAEQEAKARRKNGKKSKSKTPKHSNRRLQAAEASSSSSSATAPSGGGGGAVGGGLLRNSAHIKELAEMTEEEIVRQLASLHNMDEVKQAKAIFDRIDVDGSGSIDAKELGRSLKQNPYLYNTASVFQHLDVDHSGEISFEELLHFLFPYAKEHEYRLMAEAVTLPPVETGDVVRISKLFLELDDDFDGLVEFGQLIDAMKKIGGKYVIWVSRVKHASSYKAGGSVNAHDDEDALSGKKKSNVPASPATRRAGRRVAASKARRRKAASTSASSGAVKDGKSAGGRSDAAIPDNAKVGLREFLYEMFRRNYGDEIQRIVRDAVPVRVLTYEEQKELEKLFASIDSDGSESISLDELKEHVAQMGLTEDDCADLFDMFDRDGDADITMHEFKKFYRSVWNTTSNFDPDADQWEPRNADALV